MRTEQSREQASNQQPNQDEDDGRWNCRDRLFDHDHDDPPEWHVDIADDHQICGAVGHGIPLVILAATR
jgi:hypothetical protein